MYITTINKIMYITDIIISELRKTKDQPRSRKPPETSSHIPVSGQMEAIVRKMLEGLTGRENKMRKYDLRKIMPMEASQTR